MNTDQPAVTIVGSGIAGSALAAALATAGVPVLVLERTEQFVDHVRGEYMHPWGVAEAMQLGLHDDLINAGGNVISRFVGYDEAYSLVEAEESALPLADLLPGVPGALGIGHPVACQALFDAAVRAGAHALRGVEQVKVTPGESPAVRYVHGGSGARGPTSPRRRRRWTRILDTAPARHRDREDRPPHLPRRHARRRLPRLAEHRLVIGTSGDSILYAFPQCEDKARLYIGYSIEEKTRLAGADKAKTLLEAFRVDTIPDCGRFVDASPAGPCAAYPMFDSWSDAVVADGVGVRR